MGRDAAAVEAAVRADRLLSAGAPVLIMYSGGRDSTCLLDLAVRICGAGAVRALHVNYGLREGTVLDERHAESVCDALGVSLSIERPAGPPSSGNLQAWAREVRYAAAARHTAEADIAAGHTASDQLETVLYRLISSPSRRALVGMVPRRANLIRPLLEITRQETGAYCIERGLPFRDDPTNATPTYVRNRIRNELIPLINDLHPAASQNVLALTNVIRDENEALDESVAQAIAAGDVTLPRLRSSPRGLARLIIQRLADDAIGGPAAGVASRLGDILNMGDTAKLDLPSGARAVTDASVLRFERTPPLRH